MQTVQRFILSYKSVKTLFHVIVLFKIAQNISNTMYNDKHIVCNILTLLFEFSVLVRYIQKPFIFIILDVVTSHFALY